MKEAITNLTKQQSLRLQQLLAEHNIDAKTSSKTQKYYRQMRKMHHYFDQHPYHLEDLMRASILVAEKSQVVYTLSGQRLRGLGLSLNGMIKSGVSMQKMVGIVKLFMTYNKTIDEELREDLVEAVEEVTFGTNFIEKFERAINYFDFEELVSQTYAYGRLFSSFTWLFFLRLQTRLNIRSEVESDYLLISVLYLMVRYAFDYMRPKNTPTNVNRSNSKVLITSILQKLFQIFLIDDPVSFKRITALVDQHFEELIQTQTLKCHDCQNYDFLSPTLIAVNYKKIDMLYQRERNPASIDYRLFLLNRQSTLTPTKDTNALSRVGKQSKKRQAKPRSFASHKILTFDLEDGQSSDNSTRKCDIKLPANVKVSPSYIKTPLICAQQQSPCTLLQNFIVRQIKCNRNKLQILQNQQEIVELIRSVMEGYLSNPAKLKDHVLMTYNYYLVISTRFFNHEIYDERDFNGLHCAFLLHSMQLVIYSGIQASQQACNEIRPILQYIRGYITTTGVDLWIVNDFVQRDNSRLPPQFKELLSSMQAIIVQEVLWEDERFINEIQTLPTNTTSIHKDYILKLLTLILSQIRSQISRLLLSFNMEEKEQIESDIYKTIRYMIAVTPQAILGMHLHQILLASIYLTLRSRSLTIKFNDIINHYQQVNNVKPAQFKTIINQIVIGEGEQAINIIEYYNKHYVPFIKHHLDPIKFITFERMPEPFRRNMHEMDDNPKIKTFSCMGKNTWKGKPRLSNKKIYTEQSQPEQSRMKKSYTEKHSEEKDFREALREETNQERKSTTMRTRPIGSLLNVLKTEKIKSPPYQ